MPDLRITAPAKINLGLEVLRRRSDGYHDINTVFAAIDLCDEIRLSPRADGRVLCRVEGARELKAGEKNLCVRAARLLQHRDGAGERGIDITLVKRIPIGAGLGGGSSDAAAVLRGASLLWEIPIGADELMRMALELGSDVPFFLRGGTAHAALRGEQLTPVDLPLPYTVLLVNPGIHISTPWAYRTIGRTGERPATDLIEGLRQGVADPARLSSALVNDFEDGIFAEYPRLRKIKESLYSAGAVLALMSGSGSTMLGLFCDPNSAAAAQGRFNAYWSTIAGFLPSWGLVPVHGKGA